MRWKAIAAGIVAWTCSLGTTSAADAVFATPLPHGPGTYVPDSGPLAAPVITPDSSEIRNSATLAISSGVGQLT